jgi:hypothetical protein
MKRIWSFLKSKLFLRNLLAYLSLVAALIVLLVVFLSFYTRPGASYDVPDLVGEKVNIQDIDTYMKGSPLKYEVVETIFRTDLPEGTIFYQLPGPTSQTGMQVKTGRSIKLRMSTRIKMVAMPDLAGKASVRFAEQILTNRGFKVYLEYVYTAEGKNQVIEQKFNGKPIAPGTLLEFGARLTLVVSKGAADEEMELPNMIGLTICEARERLSNVNVLATFVCIDCDEGNEAQECRAVIYVQEPDHEYYKTIQVGGNMVFKAWLEEPEDIEIYRTKAIQLDYDRSVHEKMHQEGNEE